MPRSSLYIFYIFTTDGDMRISEYRRKDDERNMKKQNPARKK